MNLLSTSDYLAAAGCVWYTGWRDEKFMVTAEMVGFYVHFRG